jgi:regulator of RNase E activity RraB
MNNPGSLRKMLINSFFKIGYEEVPYDEDDFENGDIVIVINSPG